jgi:hypothetical protein
LHQSTSTMHVDDFCAGLERYRAQGAAASGV